MYPIRHNQIMEQQSLRCKEYNVPNFSNPSSCSSGINHYPQLTCQDFGIRSTFVDEPPWCLTCFQSNPEVDNPMFSPENCNHNSGPQQSIAEDVFSACHDELIKDTKPSSSTSYVIDHLTKSPSYSPSIDRKIQDVFAVPSAPAPKNNASKSRDHGVTASVQNSSLKCASKRSKNDLDRRRNNIETTHLSSMQNSQTVYRNWNDMKSFLSYQDYTEITDLQNSYLQLIDELPPPFRGPVTPDNFLMYASTFLQRRAKFLAACPWYASLAQHDKQHLLRVAVAISCYIIGAQLIDWENYIWPKSIELLQEIITNEPTMPLYTVRQFLSNDQFVNLMTYCKSFSKVLADIRVSLLLQTLSLFYPEPGLEDANSLENGRSHYTGLLSRYLTAVHGPETAQFHLQTLLVSQHEARHLANMLHNVEINHHVPAREFFDAKKMLVEGIRAVCEAAKERLLRAQLSKRKECDFYQDSLTMYKRQKTTISEEGFSVDSTDKVDFIQSTFLRLAECDNPEVLAEARRIIPVHLLHKLLEKLQEEPASSSRDCKLS